MLLQEQQLIFLNCPMESNSLFNSSFEKLLLYVAKEEYAGYDPYDTLCSPIPFRSFTSWGPVIATQIQKRNPFNIRPLIGIKKGQNPKAMGLFLESFVKLQTAKKGDYKKEINYFFNWLNENQSKGYKGASWGYNFPWATTEKYLPAFAPTVVATAFVVRGLYAYWKLTNDEKAKKLILDAAEFVNEELDHTMTDDGIVISYTPLFADCCYNASLLGAEVLAMACDVSENSKDREKCTSAIDFVVKQQHDDGHWKYSKDLKTGIERSQIDFHQGYVLDSILNISTILNIKNENWSQALEKGVGYYKQVQFFPDGRSMWRIPREYPVEIHNQSQGIITFSNFSYLSKDNKEFANQIAKWTIENMQDKKGYFYYRKLKYYTNKISYMRWSNAWMFRALTEVICQ